MNKLFLVVGPSRAGKTTLIEAVTKELPGVIGIVRSVTTRASRGPEDQLHYRHVSKDEVARLLKDKQMVQHIEYAGNEYGVARPDLDQVLRNRHGILAVVEEAVGQYRRAGYDVVVVRVKPVGFAPHPDPERQAADRRRAQIDIEPAVTITNSFVDPEGLQKATKELVGLIKDTVGLGR